MVKLVLVGVALITTACFEDRYRCTTDSQCDLGEAGRCELSGFCTVYDRSCDTERRYGEHAGALTGTCFDDRVAIANVCAGGQPPALADGCAADVCAALPTCCETGWSDACVQQAQLACAVRCDTRIAVTATRGDTAELWELAWNGTAWSATQRINNEQLIAWLAPAPGTTEPRRAGLAEGGATLLVDDRAFPLPLDRTYQSITSVDLDRDGRDKLVLGFQAAVSGVQVLELETGATREILTNVGGALAWGDSDRDAFPDGVAGQGTRYSLLDNLDGDGHVRTLSTTSSNVGGGGTTGSPQLRKLDWIDLDGDHQLDLAVFGSQLRVHADADRLRDTPLFTLDCDPPRLGCPMDQLPSSSFAGTALPALATPALVATSFPARHIYRITLTPGTPPAVGDITAIADDCPTCPPIIAATARDLDGDRQLDFIGLDANLRIYTALTSQGFRVIEQAIAPRPTAFPNVAISVSGAPIP
jgi:hypothetical protein